MRIVRYAGNDGVTRLGALTESGVLNLQGAARTSGIPEEPFADVLSFLAAGDSALQQAVRLVRQVPQGAFIPLSRVRLRAPIPRPGKIVAIGLNYRDHSIESGAKEPPKWPVIFAKFPTSIAERKIRLSSPRATPMWTMRPSWPSSWAAKQKAFQRGTHWTSLQATWH